MSRTAQGHPDSYKLLLLIMLLTSQKYMKHCISRHCVKVLVPVVVLLERDSNLRRWD